METTPLPKYRWQYDPPGYNRDAPAEVVDYAQPRIKLRLTWTMIREYEEIFPLPGPLKRAMDKIQVITTKTATIDLLADEARALLADASDRADIYTLDTEEYPGLAKSYRTLAARITKELNR